jgi:hypothetical protein
MRRSKYRSAHAGSGCSLSEDLFANHPMAEQTVGALVSTPNAEWLVCVQYTAIGKDKFLAVRYAPIARGRGN